jgi:hypothetical protein
MSTDYVRAFYERLATGKTTPEVEILIRGYKRAADVLVDRVLSGQDAWDSLAFPILYLYRQHLELALKACSPIVHAYRRQSVTFTGDPYDEASWKNPADTQPRHDLMALWGPIRSFLESTDLQLDPGLDQRANEVIEWFHSMDEWSTNFRYPERVERLEVDVRDLSPQELRDNVAAASIAIDGLRQWLLDVVENGKALLNWAAQEG